MWDSFRACGAILQPPRLATSLHKWRAISAFRTRKEFYFFYFLFFFFASLSHVFSSPPPMSPDLGDFDSSLYDSLTADANDDDDVNDFHLTSSSRMFPGSSSALGAVGGSSSAIGNPTIGGGSSSNSVSSGPFSLGLSPFVWGTQN